MRNLAGGVRNLNPGAADRRHRPPKPARSTGPTPEARLPGRPHRPLSPRDPCPPNVVPPGATPPGRPSVLNRPPQVAPPKFIAPGRTGTGAPPPSSGQRPGGPGGAQRPPQGAGPAGAKPLGAGGKPNSDTPMKLTPEMIERLRNASARGQRMSISDITKPQAPGAPGGPGGPGRGQDSRPAPVRRPASRVGRSSPHLAAMRRMKRRRRPARAASSVAIRGTRAGTTRVVRADPASIAALSSSAPAGRSRQLTSSSDRDAVRGSAAAQEPAAASSRSRRSRGRSRSACRLPSAVCPKPSA